MLSRSLLALRRNRSSSILVRCSTRYFEPDRRIVNTPHSRNLIRHEDSWVAKSYASLSMATDNETHVPSMDELEKSLKSLGVSEMPPRMANTYPDLNPVDIYRSHVTQLLASVSGVDPKIIYPAVQWTQTLDKGDLVLAVPALRVKGKKPDELAKELAEKFPSSPLIEPPTVFGSYLQFFFKPEKLTSLLLPTILRAQKSYGFNPSLGLKNPADSSSGRKRIIIEFSSPNIAKPFHAGHLRSTIIGGFLSNLYAAAGWDVIRMNYLGDWGKQYGVLAVGFQEFGSEEELEKNPIGHLYEVYVKISAISRDEEDVIKTKREEAKALKEKGGDVAALEKEIEERQDASVDEAARKYFKRMVDGDTEALGTWKRFRDLSIERYKETYARLNIHYDQYAGESLVKQESMDNAAKTLAEKGVSEESEGAILVDLTKYQKKLGKALVKKKDGTSLYLTRDIGEAVERFDKYHFDKMIYVVASQQDLHLAQLFKIMEVMGRKDIAERCQHINFGMVLGMSTRRGTAKFLDDILQDVGKKMHEVMRTNEDKYKQVQDPDKTADILGISAVMVQDMTGKRINNYEFDMDRMCSFEGDTGPYLQYAHARLTSIIRRATGSPDPAELIPSLLKADISLLSERHAVELVRMLVQWPDVFLQTVKTQEPITVITYLFRMTHALSSSYDHLQVVGSEERVKDARLALYVCTRQVLRNGMGLLGLTPLDRM